MAKMFLVRTFGILAVLVLVLQSLDLLTESGRVLAYAGNGDAEIWRYVGLRAPQIIATFLPYSVLLGSILTLSQLNQNSEVISMKSAGLSAHQILAPLMVTGLIVAAISFGFNDRVVARASGTLAQWKKVDYGPLPIDRGDRANVWVKDGDHLIVVSQIKGRGDAALLYGVTEYERQGQSLRSILTAPTGKRDGAGWRVENAQRFDVAAGTLTPLGTVRIADGVRP
ncbi:MAG: LptF/LptG family permease, partial [Sphingomonadales bacterium]